MSSSLPDLIKFLLKLIHTVCGQINTKYQKVQKKPNYIQKIEVLSTLSTVYPQINNFLAILSHFFFCFFVLK